MTEQWTIWAYSPAKNITHRQLDLTNTRQYQSEAEAQRDADSFAHQWRLAGKDDTQDWIGVVKWEQLGIQTIPGYLFHG